MDKSFKKRLEASNTKLTAPHHSTKIHPAQINNYQNGSYLKVDIDLINPDPNQPRKRFDQDALEELSQSITAEGVLQPVIIRTDDDKNIFLVAGERRFRAAKMAGLKEIPAVYSTGNSLEIAMIENLQREDLNPIEEAKGLELLMQEHHYTQQQLALVVGKKRATITNILSLNKLPDNIKKECVDANTFSKRLLMEVARQNTPDEMRSLFQKIKENNITSTTVRTFAKKSGKRKTQTPASMIQKSSSSLRKKLGSLNTDSIEEIEKERLIEELRNLSEAILQVIQSF